MQQISLFDGNEKLKINKPIRLIELFAGYGSQSLALDYLGANYESWKICEWAVKSIKAYKDLHCPDDNNDYSNGKSKDELIDILYELGISSDYSNPMAREQIARLGESQLRTIYNNIKATNNLVSVCNCKGKDLEITDTDKYCYVMTYSFPCQDLSNAVQGKGMKKGSGTRSGLLWEVERILNECDEKPPILLMENVPDCHGTNHIKDFAKWVKYLESIGYHCYWQDLNGKDYGIPQNRNRCFMVSCLGDYYYDFPQPIKLNKRLKDMLEDNVDEKYYLSVKIIQWFQNHTEKKQAQGCGFKFEPTNGDGIGKCISTRAGSRADDNFIQDNDRIRKLTPKECFRLMGVKDEDFEKVAKNQSNSSLYHLAGDSIIVNVLMAIFNEML